MIEPTTDITLTIMINIALTVLVMQLLEEFKI